MPRNVKLSKELEKCGRVEATNSSTDIVDMPYSKDMFYYMKKKEIERYNICYQSPQISWRRALVDWTCSVASKLGVGDAAAHLAIRLLDSFMGGHNIEISRLHFVCIGCLRIAAKFEEKDSRVPKVKALYSQLPVKYEARFNDSEYKALEIMILDYFSWNVFLPTAKQFVDLYTLVCVQKRKMIKNDNSIEKYQCGQISTAPDTISRSISDQEKKLLDFVNYFLDISLQEAELTRKFPSQIASAVIYCSRKVCHLYPFWTVELKNVSGFSISQFEDCIYILTNIYEDALREESEKNMQKCLKRCRRELQKRDTPIKRRALLINEDNSETKISTCSFTPAGNELVPSSNMLANEGKDMSIIYISPDDGYSTMSCSSVEICKDARQRTSGSKPLMVDGLDHSDISSNTSTNRATTRGIALENKTFSEKGESSTSSLNASAMYNPIMNKHYYLRCKRSLEFERFEEFSSNASIVERSSNKPAANRERFCDTVAHTNISCGEDSNEIIIINE